MYKKKVSKIFSVTDKKNQSIFFFEREATNLSKTRAASKSARNKIPTKFKFSGCTTMKSVREPGATKNSIQNNINQLIH